MYNNRSEGKAIKIRIIAGRIVQIVSINWPSSKNRCESLFNNILNSICLTKIVIKIKIKIVWSWNNVRCSIKGEALSWRKRVFHVEISKKRLNFIFGV